MRYLILGLFAFFGLLFLWSPAQAYDPGNTFTATSGVTYTRAADGQYYPAEYVRSNGSVSMTPVYRHYTPVPFIPVVPATYYQPQPQQSCPNGQCPQQRRF